VARYSGKYHQLREVAGLGTVTPAGPSQQPQSYVVLGVFTEEGESLGRLVLPSGLTESYTICLSAAAEPPYRMGGAIRGGRHGALFCPRGVITGGPPLP
jgi:hypothetical protein